MMHAVDDVTDYEANIVLNSHNIHHDYYRLQPIIEAEHINMDDVSPKNIKALEQYAQNIIQQNENQLQAIANFLNEHVIENYPILNNKAYEKE